MKTRILYSGFRTSCGNRENVRESNSTIGSRVARVLNLRRDKNSQEKNRGMKMGKIFKYPHRQDGNVVVARLRPINCK